MIFVFVSSLQPAEDLKWNRKFIPFVFVCHTRFSLCISKWPVLAVCFVYGALFLLNIHEAYIISFIHILNLHQAASYSILMKCTRKHVTHILRFYRFAKSKKAIHISIIWFEPIGLIARMHIYTRKKC